MIAAFEKLAAPIVGSDLRLEPLAQKHAAHLRESVRVRRRPSRIPATLGQSVVRHGYVLDIGIGMARNRHFARIACGGGQKGKLVGRDSSERSFFGRRDRRLMGGGRSICVRRLPRRSD